MIILYIQLSIQPIKTDKEFGGSFRAKSYQAGVRCCRDDGFACFTPTACSDNLTSYSEAVAQCAKLNRTMHSRSNVTVVHRLCNKTELLSGVCCGQGGHCDNYEVWTSTAPGMYFMKIADWINLITAISSIF